MDLSGLNITLSRVRQIENRISHIEANLERVGGNSINSFDNVLEKKINDIEYLTPPPESGYKGDLSINNPDKKHISMLIEKYAHKNGLDKSLVKAVIKAESDFNNTAVSRAGAKGLMQLMPLTARELGVSDPFDPEQNIAGGTKYLKKLIDSYNSVELGLAAYNAGPGNVNKYNGVPPFNETQNYIQRVMNFQKTISG